MKTNSMNAKGEQELINGILAGNEATLTSFYKQHLPFLKSYIKRQGGSYEDAEDIFQDALVLVYAKLQSNNDLINTTLGGYFRGTCKNLWRNQMRKQRKWAMADIYADDINDDHVSVTEQLFQTDRKNLFYSYFSTLKDTTRQLWELAFEGKSSQEIAEYTGYTEKYVRKKKCETKKQIIQTIVKDPLYRELAEA